MCRVLLPRIRDHSEKKRQFGIPYRSKLTTVIYIACDFEGQTGTSSFLLTLAPSHTAVGWAEVARPLSMWSFIIKEVSSGYSHSRNSVPREHFCKTFEYITSFTPHFIGQSKSEASPESGVGDGRVLTNMAKRQERREQDIEMWPFHLWLSFFFSFPFHLTIIFVSFSLSPSLSTSFCFQTFFPFLLQLYELAITIKYSILKIICIMFSTKHF